jgi:hypothetical protein
MEYSDGCTVTEDKLVLWLARVVIPRGCKPPNAKDPDTGRAKKRRKVTKPLPNALELVLNVPEWTYVGEGPITNPEERLTVEEMELSSAGGPPTRLETWIHCYSSREEMLLSLDQKPTHMLSYSGI